MSADAFVLDASVLVAAALPNEPHHADAKAIMQSLMAEQSSLLLPTVALAEVAAVIARGAGDERLALQVVAAYGGHPKLQWAPVDAALGLAAAQVAAGHRIRGCDAVYVALAQAQQAVLLTLDRQQRERAPADVPARTPAQAGQNGSSHDAHPVRH
jgi:predicted nucleic acid-binding protein